jgi:type VI protein secretion system component Hcp
MKKNNIIAILFIFITNTIGFSQNVGIQQHNPSEPLEVGGIIFTNQGGIKFPDSTIQTTAATNSSIPNPDLANYTMQAILTLDGFSGSFNDAPLGIINGIPLLSYNANFKLNVSPFTSGGAIRSENGGILIEKNADITSHVFFEKHFGITIIPEGKIFFLRTNNNGQSEVYKRIEIEIVYITDINQKQHYNGLPAYTDVEEIKIEFRKLKIYILTQNGEECACFDFVMRTTCGC